MFVEGMHRAACSHSETTDPDGDGVVICVRCGCAFHAVLTIAVLERTFDQIRGAGRDLP